MTVHSRLAKPLVDSLRKALTRDALPGETQRFGREHELEAAEFLAGIAEKRKRGEVALAIESTGGEAGRRRMRIGIVNDDMPFLVDSVANAIAARQLTIHRLLHPVVCAKRDADGVLREVEPLCGDHSRQESMMYIELDRADARGRQELAAELRAVLADVRVSVSDWKALQARMHQDAKLVADPEGSALLNWFADGAMTLLGYQVERPGEQPSQTLGIFSIPGAPTDPGGSVGAIRYFEQGGEVPLLAKAERKSTVHRRVPLDLVVVPIREGDKITGIGVHAGLWTSQALTLPAEEVPVLRRRLDQLDKDFGFDPKGHSGKALRHAVSSLPRDLLINLSLDAVRELVMMAMSLADRPRPALLQVRSILKGHLFTFVWLPREELTTARRKAIAMMLGAEVAADVSSWSVELGDGDLALIRYTQYLDASTPMPDEEALDAALVEMVKGWAPAVEAEMIESVGAARATRLALGYIPAFPDSYRNRTSPEEAAADILELCALESDNDRRVRIWRSPSDGPGHLRLKTYRRGGLIPLSDVVPVMENFGFRVLEEMPTVLGGGTQAFIHDFRLEIGNQCDLDQVLGRADEIESAIARVLCGISEDDEFNQLVLYAGLETRAVVWLRAWFRYLRQTGSSFGLVTVVDALRRAPDATRALVELFAVAHDPARKTRREAAVAKFRGDFDQAIAGVRSIDDDRILRRWRALVDAILRTNAFAPAAEEALAFKLDSSLVPALPAPVPWREIWVYSPRVEGIHLRGGPIARGGLRWSDRRDDFRTEILGLIKAQMVKNAVIVPTGAKGGFYPKQLPPSANRDAWLAEGTESYRIFIRALLSVTDNLVNDKVVHPDGVVIHDGDDPYFVVAADKGTAAFSDVANAIALEHNFWLGDAFASGGSHGYDHKAMGITARGAWVSVQRHFAEMGVDVQNDIVRVAGCGDMSGDVFGNGMLLSKTLKLIAAFDHRHIFLDPDPDPATSWKERKRMFGLPRSNWADYDEKLLSRGGAVFPRTMKRIQISKQAAEALGIEAREFEPDALINAILKAPADLLWFGGIGTYVRASSETDAQVGDPANDALRVTGEEVRAKVIGEGANLGTTQAGRIEFALHGGRINTDFIDNSAGVDCSDNEVNIKIALDAAQRAGRLSESRRNAVLAEMTDEVAALVLEDNRLQALALSIAQTGGARAVASQIRLIETLETTGELDRKTEGLAPSDALARRAMDGKGLTRPELAVLLSTTKLVLQDAMEASGLAEDAALEPLLLADFPEDMQGPFKSRILHHRLRNQIVATVVANKIVNRMGLVHPFELAEEESASLDQVCSAFVAASVLLGLDEVWHALESAKMAETARIKLFEQAALALRSHMADLLRTGSALVPPSEAIAELRPGVAELNAHVDDLLEDETRDHARRIVLELAEAGAPEREARLVARLFEMDGAIGLAALARDSGISPTLLARAFVDLGARLGLDWAQSTAAVMSPSDPWERLLVAGLARDFQQMRLEFLRSLARRKAAKDDLLGLIETWAASHGRPIHQFRAMVGRAQAAAPVAPAMLAQIASQARSVLKR